ncbi:hypothetical protein [Marinoscillum furvescens]|uniref:Uncharacterized protein n=1 Tax=Marinoscillum furvescens DSM 4134 TaxID=1122208 RepID=A0A3D9L3J2_MARFU|nr:hypothetical protein [Marinoscillum furvescens]RED96661.1 hypothetical protein C7460_114119 [Marinoscillum furvescens DSM 4134]
MIPDDHPYFRLTKKQRAIFIGKSALTCGLGVFALSMLAWWGFGSLMVLVVSVAIGCSVSLSILAPFVDLPSLVKNNRIGYLSPFLLWQKSNDKIILHGGTLVEYWFYLDKKWNASERKRHILHQYLLGLQQLIYRELPPHTTIQATTHIVGKNTLKRLGFKTISKNEVQLIILTLNYPNLLCTMSLAHGRLQFPNLRMVKSFETTAEELNQRSEQIQLLLQKLEA